jgi:transmembrane sensor
MRSNVFSLPKTNDAASKAQEWIIKIDSGPLTPSERIALQDWLSNDENNGKLLDTYALLWSEASKAKFSASTPKKKIAINGQIPTGLDSSAKNLQPTLNWTTYGSVLAIFCLCLIPIIWLNASSNFLNLPTLPSQNPITAATEIGQNLELPLVDGSRVRLNTASTISVMFDGQKRQILLEKGEGLFEVAKDEKRPFEVVAGRTTVRAIGTRFSVILFPDGRTDVTVFEGVVEVVTEQSQKTTQPLRLGVGQTMTVQAEKIALQQLSNVSLANKLAWQEDRIVFDNITLAEAVTQVNRYSKLPLQIKDPELMNLHITGSFSTPEIQIFIRSLEQGFGLYVEKTADFYVITKTSPK